MRCFSVGVPMPKEPSKAARVGVDGELWPRGGDPSDASTGWGVVGWDVPLFNKLIADPAVVRVSGR